MMTTTYVEVIDPTEYPRLIALLPNRECYEQGILVAEMSYAYAKHAGERSEHTHLELERAIKRADDHLRRCLGAVTYRTQRVPLTNVRTELPDRI